MTTPAPPFAPPATTTPPITAPPSAGFSFGPPSTGAPEKAATETAAPETAVHEKEVPERAVAVTLTISEAARACDVNRRTIRHHRQSGDFPGAFKDQDGMWRIPMEDLEWVGLHPDLGRVAEVPVPSGKVDLLRTEVAVLRERLRAAELIAMEREKRIDDLRLILRLLPSPSLSGSPLAPAQRLTAGHGVGPAGIAAGERSTASDHAEADIGDSDPVIWLPDAPERREVSVSVPSRSADSPGGSIWTPGGSPVSPKEARMAPVRDHPAAPPQSLGAPLDVRMRRRPWLPWRRHRR